MFIGEMKPTVDKQIWSFFTFMIPCIVTNFFIIKPTRCTNSPTLPRHETGRARMELLESCLQTCMTYTIAECTVNKLLMMGRGTARNM
jgi:hypothetical protein